MRQKNLPMVELLLHEPINACTMYLLNSKGESAYDIDKKNDTCILSQLFGTSKFYKNYLTYIKYLSYCLELRA